MLLQWLTDPFQFEFMQRGFVAALFVGILCSVIGCYVVLRAMAFMGDAIAHAILPGIAIAYIFQGNLLLGALVASILVSILINTVSTRSPIKEDTAIGIIFSAALALGVALISGTARTYAVDLSHILFGNILGVQSEDLWITAILGIGLITLIIVLYKQFLVISFDPILAATLGYSTSVLRLIMIIMISLTVVVSVQSVGVGLVSALLVTPAAAALLLANRLPRMMLISAFFGAFSGTVGLYISYYLNIASGPAIVLVATSIFILAYLFSPQKGILISRRNRSG